MTEQEAHLRQIVKILERVEVTVTSDGKHAKLLHPDGAIVWRPVEPCDGKTEQD